MKRVLVVLLLASGVVASAAAPGMATSLCPPLPEPTGPTITVGTTSELQQAVDNLASGATILIEDGTYQLTNTLNIRGVSDVTVRSASGNRNAVVLQGMGMSDPNYGNVPHVIAIYDAQNVTIADMTLRDAYYHLVQVHGEADADFVRFYNLHLVDSGEQFIKVSTAGSPGPYADGGVVECSLFEYTDRARSDYTNAVDVLAGSEWVIRDNEFHRIRAPQGELAGPAVLLWRNTVDSVVERNLFVECDRAIALGLSSPDANTRDGNSTYDFQNGIVRNNMIYREGAGDIGITVNYARNVSIYHNTVIQNGTFPWGTIEYRFDTTDAAIFNNLTDGPIWHRDNASGSLGGNVTNATTSSFVDAPSGDLHLTSTAMAAIDQAVPVPVSDDFDGEFRPAGNGPDVGADEWGSTGPVPASGFRDVPPGHLFESDIAWLAGEGITKGCNPPVNDLYCPGAVVTREQMATFLTRALELPAGSSNFADVAGSVHEADIGALAAAGITRGCNPPTNDLFCPQQAVSREQMAAFLARALTLNGDLNGTRFVDDDGSVFETDIERIAIAGITLGCNPPANDLFCPDEPVLRGQMAAFLHRALTP